MIGLHRDPNRMPCTPGICFYCQRDTMVFALDEFTCRRCDARQRAVALIDAASPGDLTGYLTRTSIHGHLKADPAALRDHLATADGSGPVFSAWKASQQLLKAAGLPY